ncbi:MAG: hypothetical protein HOE90_00665 [Bacteriovoracaceae bacterium]|jgi:hypothetical protein|nr:hypothetical protein [Bacteriovoracaceae bacterium]
MGAKNYIFKKKHQNNLQHEIASQGEGARSHLKKAKKAKRISCNLCNKRFQPGSRFERFCKTCKDENEYYLDSY